MTNFMCYVPMILSVIFTFSNAEPIKGNNVVTAEEGEFPFVAAIIKKTGYLNAERDQFCSGVLISKNQILTAEHCFDQPLDHQSFDRIQIILGSADLRNGTRYNASTGITYDQWAKSKGIHKRVAVNDIAIIKLSEEVDERVAKPVELSSKKRFNFFKCERVTIVGWGYTNLKPNRPSRHLQKSSLTVLSAKQCQNAISRLLTNETIIVDKQIFCTKAEPFTLIGGGDSGGPLLNSNNQVVGINMGTSPKYIVVKPHQKNDRVNLHADVHYYQSFIEDVLKNH